MFYDFKKTLTSKSILIITIAIILISSISVGSAVETAAHPPTSNLLNSSAALYYNSEGYHLLIFTFSGLGEPLAGVQCRFILSVENYSSHNYNTTGSTDSNGLVTLTVNPLLANLSQRQQLLVANTYAASKQFFLATVRARSSSFEFGTRRGLRIGICVRRIDASNASQYHAEVFYAGPGGTPPKNYSVYYEIYNSTSKPTSSLTGCL